jgi:RNA polymerase sigma factor (sigma-70 family)
MLGATRNQWPTPARKSTLAMLTHAQLPTTTFMVNRPGVGRLTREQVAQLIGSAAAGDQRAWDAIVQEFGGLIWAIARAHGLRDADAADVAQTAWVKLFEQLEHLKDPGSAIAWLATTTRRECQRVSRCAQRYVFFGEEAPELASSGELPGDALLTEERDRALWRSFARLRATDQALLRLLMADHHPAYDEISAALGMPVGSIGPTRARALKRLRGELERAQALSLLAA